MRHRLARLIRDVRPCVPDQTQASANLVKLDQSLADYRAAQGSFAVYLRNLELAQTRVIFALAEFEKFPHDDLDRALSIVHLIKEFNEIRWRLAWAQQHDPNIDVGSQKALGVHVPCIAASHAMKSRTHDGPRS